MTNSCFIYFFALLSLTSGSYIGIRRLFPEPKQYIYIIKSNISTHTILPEEIGSHWTLEAKLYAQVHNNNSRVRYRLDDIKTAVFERTLRVSGQFPTAAAVLKQSWDVYYQSSGIVSSVHVTENEPIWSGNIKRAISLTLQVYKPEGGNSVSYSVQEPCLHGLCLVEYTSLDGKSIRKTHDIPTVEPGFGRFYWYSVPMDTCYRTQTRQPFIGSAERIYQLDPNKGLLDLDLKSSLQYATARQILEVTTELSINLDKAIEMRGLEDLRLNFSYPAYYAHSYKDPTNGRQAPSQAQLLNATRNLLYKIAKAMDVDRVVKNLELIHSLDMINLHKTMSQLDYETLTAIYDELAVGTSYENETCRNIFLEVLPQIKTSAFALFIKYLVVEQKQLIEDAVLLSLIRKLPFNVANYSQDLLVKMEPFTALGLDFSRELRYACILSYATLAYNTYMNGGCTSDYFGNIVTKYFKMYTEYPSYIDRFIWLQGLSNLQVGAVYNYLAPKITNTTTNRHERFLALWATIPNSAADPLLGTVLSWPILTNKNEHIELRLAALVQLLAAEQTPARILAIHKYIVDDDDEQLKRFWYTTGRTLRTNQYSCYPSAKYISHVSRLLPTPDSIYWATGNYIYDIAEKDSDDLMYVQLITIGEPSSGLPGFAYFNIRTASGGLVTKNLGLIIKAEGVPTYFFMKLKEVISKTVKFATLAEQLRNMKVHTVTLEKVHIDIIVKNQDKTIFATHLNQTTLNNWKSSELQRTIQDFVQSGSHINQQLASFPVQVDLNLPTELGTPVILQTTETSLSSIRGIFSTLAIKDDFTLENNINFRFQGTSITSLSTIGPIVLTEHTARIQQSTVIHVPINLNVSTASITRSVRLSLRGPERGGLVRHTRVQLAVQSDTGVHIHNVFPSSNYQGELGFDCDETLSEKEFIDRYFSIHHINSLSISSLEVSIPTLRKYKICGFLYLPFIYMYAPNMSLDIYLAVEGYDVKLDVYDLQIAYNISMKETGRLRSISGVTQISNTGQRNIFSLSLQLGNDRYIQQLICINQTEENSFSDDRDNSKHPSNFRGKIDILFPDNPTCPSDVGGGQIIGLVLDYRVSNAGQYGDEGTRRYFNVTTVVRLPPEFPDFLSNFGDNRLFAWIPRPQNDVMNFTINIKEQRGIVDLMVEGSPAFNFKSENLHWLLDNWSNMQLMRKLGMYKECRLQESTVRTLVGTIERVPSTKCRDSLVLAECTDKPGFTIIRHDDEGYALYFGDDKIEIEPPTLGVVNVKVNDVQINYTEGYRHTSSDFEISHTSDFVKFRSSATGIRLYYSASESRILLPSPYMDVVCGECMSTFYHRNC